MKPTRRACWQSATTCRAGGLRKLPPTKKGEGKNKHRGVWGNTPNRMNKADHIMEQSIKKRLAFSLLELLAVVTILGILAVIVLPRIGSTIGIAKEKSCFYNRATINSAVERYYIEHSVWPANDLSDIGADPNYFPEGIPVCPVTGVKYKLNAATHRVNGHTGGKGGSHWL